MFTIRPYEKRDFRYVQDICFKTSWLANKPNQTNRAVVCSMYCDYYLDNEPDYIFVAVDENDIPVGYVLCAVDLDNYHEQMTENYLPAVRKLSGADYFRFAAEVKLEQRYIKQGYTAHLHLDILEEYRFMGMNSEAQKLTSADSEEYLSDGIDAALLDALTNKLKEKFVEGLFIVCSTNDEVSSALYEKHGFDDIDYFTGCVVYAKKLFREDD